MKLFDLHEQESGLDPFGEWVKGKVKRRIEKGDSRLKKLLRGTHFTLDHVQYAIKNGECMSNSQPGEKSLGPTYLEQTVSNTLRDLVTDKELSLDQLNAARSFFGLVRLGRKQLKKEIQLF